MRFILSVALITMFGFVQQSCQSEKTENKSAATTTAAATPAQAASPNNPYNLSPSTAAKTTPAPDLIPRISLADAKKAFDSGKAIFIDTRNDASYKDHRIKGAINIQAEELNTRFTELPKNKQVIAYCSWPSEHTSARAVQILKEKGIENAAALLGGTQAWIDAGYPTESDTPKPTPNK